jgi:hypothetical protein
MQRTTTSFFYRCDMVHRTCQKGLSTHMVRLGVGLSGVMSRFGGQFVKATSMSLTWLCVY